MVLVYSYQHHYFVAEGATTRYPKARSTRGTMQSVAEFLKTG
jgi:hypothetical protein